MKITDSFHVDAPIDRVWELLTDPAAVAPCLPGAAVTGTDGEDHLGTVAVKVGPMQSTFKGKMRFVDVDSASHRAVMSASGSDTRGGGNATATIVAQAVADDGGTTVSVDTDLAVVGKLGQLGTAVMQQVSTRLFAEFAERLQAMLQAAPPTAAPSAEPAAAAEPEPLDLVRYAGGPLARAAVPVAVAALAAIAVGAYLVLR